ncbi:MAG: ankyrin repeat domain-containing protein, partial [Planctomycetia bacterium]|nr:ankyrin repeat domain-containing protein [Planctomycetia bacterium]
MIVSLRSLSNTVSLGLVLRASLALVLVLFLSQAVQAQSPAFWRAIETNDINTLRTELMRGANPNARHPDHGPAIVAAARFKAFDVVRVLASLNATDVDAASVADENALMLVSTLGDRRSFDALLQRGAQVNRPGWTPLHYAASGGQLELVKVLIEQHAFIDAQSPNNTTPLMMAARMRALPVVQYLIDQGADPSLRNQAGLDAAAYLERSGERQWAIWMKERAQRYVARYGTVEQPRWTATDSSDGGAAGGAQADLAPVQMNREVSVAPDTRQQGAGGPSGSGATVPGQGASAGRPMAASQPAAQQGGGTAATGAKPAAAASPKPAAQGASAAVAPS